MDRSLNQWIANARPNRLNPTNEGKMPTSAIIGESGTLVNTSYRFASHPFAAGRAMACGTHAVRALPAKPAAPRLDDPEHNATRLKKNAC
jgi:hypothetical protein